MALLLPIFIPVLLASTAAGWIKILDTPDGKMSPEPCVTVCSGVDKNYFEWWNSESNPGKVWKKISMSGCDFVSQPVVTAVAGSGSGKELLCPSVTVNNLNPDRFTIYSVSDYTYEKMRRHECRIYWTATGFTC